MSYIGTPPNQQLRKITSQSFNGDGSTTVFTLNRSVDNGESLEVFVDNVQQEPGTTKSYTAAGTSLTFSEAPQTGTGNVYVIYRGVAEVTTRLEHDPNQALQATTGTFSGALSATTGTFTGNVDINGNELILDADGDTSITADTDDQIDFKTGGSDRVTIDSSGNVGIGTSSPNADLELGGTGEVLRLSGSSTNAYIRNTDGTTNQWYIGSGGNAGLQHYVYQAQPMTFHTSGTERMRLDSAGKLNINDTAGGTPSFGAPLIHIDAASTHNGVIVENHRQDYTGFGCHADNNTGTRYSLYMVNGSNTYVGAVSYTSTSTSYSTASDYRLKENAVDMTGAITRVKQLQPKRFNFIVDANTTVDGFMAHEAATVVPEAVTGTHNEVDDDGNAVYQSIDQAKLVPLLTGALKEAIAKIEALETRVQALEDA